MHWYDIVAWILQIAGAGGAIWGLYSSETSEVSGPAGRKRLTGKGRAALVGVLVGVCGFGLNQWQDAQREADAERQRRVADDRANSDAAMLASVREDQQRQNASQLRQIAFLRHLSLVQQQLSGLEFSWATSRAINQRTSDAVRSAIQGGLGSERWQPAGADVYYEPCLLHSEFILTRRPNYSWRLDCKVPRPQGLLPVTFELALGDRKTVILDRFLDALLSPQFLLRTSAGEEVASLSTGRRPSRIERRSERFIFGLTPATTRFSALDSANLVFQMDLTDRALLPERIRVRSLDSLASFDQELDLKWDIRTVEVIRTIVDVGDTQPTEAVRRAAVSKPVRIRVNFDRLLNVVADTVR